MGVPLRKSWILVASAIIISVFLLYNGGSRPTKVYSWAQSKLSSEPSTSQNSNLKSFSSDIQSIFEPIRLTPTGSFLNKETNTEYTLENKIWTQPLGSALCIVDIDTRAFDKPGQLFSGSYSWNDADNLSAGMLNHFMYATMHGYNYSFIHTQKWPNDERDDVWTKVPQLRNLLDSCQIVVVVDSDVTFQHLELPFEWLLNRWNFTMEHSLAMPFDVEAWVNEDGVRLLEIPDVHDTTGLLSVNAGVVIARSSPRTKEIVDAWVACPQDEDRFPGCSEFAHGWPAEQGAFSQYIRHHYAEPNDLRYIPCDDAMGFPGNNMNCSGTFLRHYTSDKQAVKTNVGQVLLSSLYSAFAMQANKALNG